MFVSAQSSANDDDNNNAGMRSAGDELNRNNNIDARTRDRGRSTRQTRGSMKYKAPTSQANFLKKGGGYLSTRNSAAGNSAGASGRRSNGGKRSTASYNYIPKNIKPEKL